MKHITGINQSIGQRISHDEVLTRIGELEKENLNTLARALLTSRDGTVTVQGGDISPVSGLTVRIAGESVWVQKKDSTNAWVIVQQADTDLTASTADPTNPRIDLVEGRYHIVDQVQQTVDIINTTTLVITPETRYVDRVVKLQAQITAGTPAGSPVCPDVTTATAATYTGTNTETFDLSTNYNIRISVDGASAVTVDCRGGTPAATTAAEIAALIDAATGVSVASDDSGKVKLLSPTTGEDSAIVLTPPTSLDALNEIFGLTESADYEYEYTGGRGYFKLGELTVGAGVGTITAGNIRDVDDRLSWKAGTTSLNIRMTDLYAHQVAATLDHPDLSVTEAKLSTALQTKINAPALSDELHGDGVLPSRGNQFATTVSAAPSLNLSVQSGAALLEGLTGDNVSTQPVVVTAPSEFPISDESHTYGSFPEDYILACDGSQRTIKSGGGVAGKGGNVQVWTAASQSGTEWTVDYDNPGTSYEFNVTTTGANKGTIRRMNGTSSSTVYITYTYGKPRYDIVQVNNTNGTASVKVGSPAAYPSLPAPDAGNLMIYAVLVDELVVQVIGGLTNSDLVDKRAYPWDVGELATLLFDLISRFGGTVQMVKSLTTNPTAIDYGSYNNPETANRSRAIFFSGSDFVIPTDLYHYNSDRDLFGTTKAMGDVRVAKSKDGRYIAHSWYVGNEIWIRFSRDGGLTWTESAGSGNLGHTAYTRSLTMALGKVFLLNREITPGSRATYLNAYDMETETWDTEIALANTDSIGNPLNHVLWAQEHPSYPADKTKIILVFAWDDGTNIKVQRSVDAGVSWNTAQNLVATTAEVDLIVRGTGTGACVLYRSGTQVPTGEVTADVTAATPTWATRAMTTQGTSATQIMAMDVFSSAGVPSYVVAYWDSAGDTVEVYQFDASLVATLRHSQAILTGATHVKVAVGASDAAAAADCNCIVGVGERSSAGTAYYYRAILGNPTSGSGWVYDAGTSTATTDLPGTLRVIDAHMGDSTDGSDHATGVIVMKRPNLNSAAGLIAEKTSGSWAVATLGAALMYASEAEEECMAVVVARDFITSMGVNPGGTADTNARHHCVPETEGLLVTRVFAANDTPPADISRWLTIRVKGDAGDGTPPNETKIECTALDTLRAATGADDIGVDFSDSTRPDTDGDFYHDPAIHWTDSGAGLKEAVLHVGARRQTFTATSGQTVFTITNSWTVGGKVFADPIISVLKNGILLGETEYAVDSVAGTITLTVGALVGDEVRVYYDVNLENSSYLLMFKLLRPAGDTDPSPRIREIGFDYAI